MERLLWKKALSLAQRLVASSSDPSLNHAMKEELWLELDQYAHGLSSDWHDYCKILF